MASTPVNISTTPHSKFAHTRWSLVLRAQGASPEARSALSELCESYWLPVYQSLRATGKSDEDSREITQSFFAFLLASNRLQGAQPLKGRFRSYLLGALKHFQADQHERQSRLKRGGESPHESLDLLSPHLEIAPSAPDIPSFDREWALTLVSRALARVATEYENGNRSSLFQYLKQTLTGAPVPTQFALASELHLTEGAVKVAVHRLREKFREAVREEIAQTLPEGEDPDDELRYLIEVLLHSAIHPSSCDLPFHPAYCAALPRRLLP